MGAYLGLAPAKDQSGNSDPQRRISKEGDEMLRRLLIGSAHYILGPFAQDSDLRRHGMKIAERGGKKRKEVSCGGGGEKALGAPAPPVDHRRGLRAAPQRQAISCSCRGADRLIEKSASTRRVKGGR